MSKCSEEWNLYDARRIICSKHSGHEMVSQCQEAEKSFAYRHSSGALASPVMLAWSCMVPIRQLWRSHPFPDLNQTQLLKSIRHLHPPPHCNQLLGIKSCLSHFTTQDVFDLQLFIHIVHASLFHCTESFSMNQQPRSTETLRAWLPCRHVVPAMAHPLHPPSEARMERQVRRAVATFQTCADLGRAHSFPLPLQPLDEFSMETTMDLLERAGQKLDFQPEDLVAWVDQPETFAKVKGPQQFCHCGLSTPQEECFQALCQYLGQMVADQRRKGQPILLHVRRKAAGCREDLPFNEPSAAAGLVTASSPITKSLSGYASSSELAAPVRVQKLQKQAPRDLRLQAQGLWAALEKARVYIPPLEAEKANDKFHLERHGHGRGNTKSTKKRRKRQDRHDLCRCAQCSEIYREEQVKKCRGRQVLVKAVLVLHSWIPRRSKKRGQSRTSLEPTLQYPRMERYFYGFVHGLWLYVYLYIYMYYTYTVI